MKKRALLAALFIIFVALSIQISSAQEEAEKVDAAYSWLISQVDGRWTTFDSEEISLALLALSYDDRLREDGKAALLAKKNTRESCWPSACKLKSTAFAMLALSRLEENTDDIADWFSERQIAFKVSGITWLLQLDSSQETNCTIGYDGKDYKLVLHENKTYSWPAAQPACLRITDGNYWITINCPDKTYSVSCDSPAIISLPYRLGQTLYVPSESYSAPADVSIKTVCLREGLACSYEGTLLAAYALMKSGKEYTHLMPYLIGEAENNKKFIPDALLFLLTGREEHAANLLAQQSREGFWTDIGGRGRYWDTALAYLALSDYAPENITQATNWLLSIQNTDGSFGVTYKIRDTAFILYSIWPKAMAVGLNDCADVYNYNCRPSCFEDEEQVDYSCTLGICCKPVGVEIACESIEDCSKPECEGKYVTDFYGRLGKCEFPEETCTDSFDNDNDGLIDMDDPDCALTCFDLGGEECAFDEECDGVVRKTIETDYCCIGQCIPSEKTCQEQGGVLCKTRNRCEGEIIPSSDTNGGFCCIGECKRGLFWPFFIITIILLGIAGYFAYKKGFFKRFFERPLRRPPAPVYRPPVRPYMPPTPPAVGPLPPKKPITKKEKELEETFGKLKKIAGK